jgi:energy-coupling factor transport system ATP-binding protein
MVPPAEMRRMVEDAARMVRFDEALTRSPQELSGGQKQRVSMAGVLVNRAEILLFDEPLANLDPGAGKQAVEIIDRLNREEHKTVIIIEHRLEDVLHRPVDRIILLREGRIAADMKPEKLLASGLLRGAGIREPLYLEALRFSGQEPAEGCADAASVVFDPEKLRAWAETPAARVQENAGKKPLLEIRGLSFNYDNDEGRPDAPRRNTLENISLVLPEGSVTALAGKNGAGKSTLAALVCGFETPGAGALFFDGKDMAGLSIRERAEKAGFVMQNPNHMISFPLVYDEAALGLRVRGTGENETRERVYGIFQVCGLYPYRNWPVSALSYGMKKRLTIASILVLGPPLLILDEPTAGQDLRRYREIMEFLLALKREQHLTLLLITHDMHLMLEYADRAAVLADGRLVAEGSPAEILADDSIIAAANLKRTSLYDLARRAEIKDAAAFVETVLAAERERREKT